MRNAIEHAFVVGEGPVLHESDLPPELRDPQLVGEPEGPRVNAPPLLPAALSLSPEGAHPPRRRARRRQPRARGEDPRHQ
jgi:hypothetical protein